MKIFLEHPQNDWMAHQEIESGTIVTDWYDEGVRVIIMRGPNSYNVYFGVPSSHPLAGHLYDDLPVSVHGGLTYACEGGAYWPEGFYWYGADYSHAGDCSFYDIKYGGHALNHTRWTPEMIKKDVWGAIYDFKHLMKLAEAIVNKVTNPSN